MGKSFARTTVHITIETNIAYETTSERTETKAIGTVHLKDGTAFCSYEDETEAGLVKNTIKILPESVTITRSGALAMRQQFIVNQKTEGSYHTPYGRLPLATQAKHIRFLWDSKNNTGTLELTYDLWMQEGYTGFYDITIQMEGV